MISGWGASREAAAGYPRLHLAEQRPERLSPKVRDYCEQGTARFYLSLVSPWEMQIKRQLGKLKYEPITDRIVRANIERNNINLLPITLAHVEHLADLRCTIATPSTAC